MLTVGGRYVCGDPNSIMPVWAQPNGPLNYRQVQEIIEWITASNDISFTYAPAAAEGAGRDCAAAHYGHRLARSELHATTRRDAGARLLEGRQRPAAAPRAIARTGRHRRARPTSPREIDVEGTDQLKWVDPTTGNQITQLAVVPGEVIDFKVDVNSAVAHSFHIGPPRDLSRGARAERPARYSPQFANGTQTFTYTCPPTCRPDRSSRARFPATISRACMST